MSLRLAPNSNWMCGAVGTKNIHVQFHPATGYPQPGNYSISPPIQDPVYGPVARVEPAGVFVKAVTINNSKSNS